MDNSELAMKLLQMMFAPNANNSSQKALIDTTPAKRQIVIGDRGWVWVADVTKIGDDYKLTNASVIRKWGTTKGIGELALAGKTSDTILDPCGSVTVPGLAVIALIDVKEGAKL